MRRNEAKKSGGKQPANEDKKSAGKKSARADRKNGGKRLANEEKQRGKPPEIDRKWPTVPDPRWKHASEVMSDRRPMKAPRRPTAARYEPNHRGVRRNVPT